MNWLTSEQAMADFAYLIDQLRHEPGAAASPVIGFGGSYGGMIGAWFRVHYPNAVDGVIAASAPIWSFDGLDPPYNPNAFDATVRDDATIGVCAEQLKGAWPVILELGETAAGRAKLHDKFRTCAPLRPKDPKNGVDDALAIVRWASAIWGTIAMVRAQPSAPCNPLLPVGFPREAWLTPQLVSATPLSQGDYPYPSSYLLHGKSLLPAWPVKTACLPLEFPLGTTDELLDAVRQSAAVVYNNTYDQPCYNITGQPGSLAPDRQSTRATMAPRLQWHHHSSPAVRADPEAAACEGSWGYQWCTEMTQPFVEGTDDDLCYCPNGTFYPAENCSNWDFAGAARGCLADWGVSPRKEWARVALGGKRLSGASNIVFSNGLLDPWHNGGVLEDISPTVVAVKIPNGAHHIDLMFSDPADAAYPDIKAARDAERQHIARWVAEAYAKHRATGTVL